MTVIVILGALALVYVYAVFRYGTWRDPDAGLTPMELAVVGTIRGCYRGDPDALATWLFIYGEPFDPATAEEVFRRG